MLAFLSGLAAAGEGRFAQDGPNPALRVGLADGVPAARISAPSAFFLRAGDLRIEAVEVVVSPETEGSVRVLALGSFSNEERARGAASSFRETQGSESGVRMARHPDTGRTLAVLASPAPGESWEAQAERLRAEGFPQAGVFQLPAASGDALLIRPLGGAALRIPGGVTLTVEPPAAGGFLEWEGRPYRGVLILYRRGDGVTVVNRVPLEEYLRGVVPSELPPDLFPELAALKAQALAARTYALRPREVYRDRGYDICSGPACQVYGGAAAEHPLTDAAVRETAGEVLYHDGKLIDALYTAACGGHTENAENVFSTPTPYLVARACVREAGGATLISPAPADDPLDAAVARMAGALPDGFSGSGLGEPVSLEEALGIVAAAVEWFGLPVCEVDPAEATPAGPLTLGRFAELVEAVRCRNPEGLYRGPGPDGSALAGGGPPAVGRLLAEGLFDPSEAGLDPRRTVSRREVVGFAARLLGRDPGLFRRGQVREAGAGGIAVEPERSGPPDRDRDLLWIEPASEARLFREVRPVRIPGRADPAPLAVPVGRLRLRVGDFVRYRPRPGEAASRPDDEAGIEFEALILEDRGDALDRFSRQSTWLVPKNNRDLSAAVARVRPIGEIVALEPLEYGRSGRIVRLRFVGTEGEWEARGLQIRRLLGISENLFFAEPRRHGEGEVIEWWFTGRGWGHGLGLCQAGAYGMAAAGADYREILAHYYHGTSIAPAR